MPTVGVRLMRIEELATVLQVWRRSRDQALPWLMERMRPTLEGDLRHFRDVVLPNSDAWVAVLDGTVAGMMALKPAHVDMLYVEPESQGRGVGTALLEQAKTLMPDGLTLFTHQRNRRARDFYEKHGFRAVAFGVSPPPESEPDVRYAWVRG